MSDILSADEIFQLTAPVRQHAAQARRLAAMLGCQVERETKREPQNKAWLADQFRKQEERRCYVCGAPDDGGCHGVDGERAECPWY